MPGDAGWEHAAGAWSEFVRSGTDVLYEATLDDFLQLLPPPGRLVVDVGCGEGRVDRRLAALGYRVVAIDASETLVRLAGAADSDSDYRVADAARLPLRDAEADLVVSFMALHDVRDLEGALAEAARLLEVFGALCLTVVHPVASGGDFDGPGLDATFVLDRYFPARTRRFPLFETEVEQFHRPFAE